METEKTYGRICHDITDNTYVAILNEVIMLGKGSYLGVQQQFLLSNNLLIIEINNMNLTSAQ